MINEPLHTEVPFQQNSCFHHVVWQTWENKAHSCHAFPLVTIPLPGGQCSLTASYIHSMIFLKSHKMYTSNRFNKQRKLWRLAKSLQRNDDSVDQSTDRSLSTRGCWLNCHGTAHYLSSSRTAFDNEYITKICTTSNGGNWAIVKCWDWNSVDHVILAEMKCVVCLFLFSFSFFSLGWFCSWFWLWYSPCYSLCACVCAVCALSPWSS